MARISFADLPFRVLGRYNLLAQLNSWEYRGLRILAGLEVFQISPSRCVA
jgi:hypothetical protein